MISQYSYMISTETCTHLHSTQTIDLYTQAHTYTHIHTLHVYYTLTNKQYTNIDIYALTISTGASSGGPVGPFLSAGVSEVEPPLEMVSKKSSLSLSNTSSMASFLAEPFLPLFFGCWLKSSSAESTQKKAG